MADWSSGDCQSPPRAGVAARIVDYVPLVLAGPVERIGPGSRDNADWYRQFGKTDLH